MGNTSNSSSSSSKSLDKLYDKKSIENKISISNNDNFIPSSSIIECSNHNNMLLDSFPDELLMKILSFLEVKDFFSLACVCKRFYKLTKDKTFENHRVILIAKRYSVYTIVAIGAGGVGGKSALIVRFVLGSFVEKYDPTIEDSYRKLICVDGVKCTLDIWDTAGQEEYAVLRDRYIKTGQGFIISYDITSKTSFETVSKLKSLITRIKSDYPYFPCVLVGAKSDLAKDRSVPFEAGKELAAKWQCPFFEVSNKLNINVSDPFFALVREIRKWRLTYSPPIIPEPKLAKRKKKLVSLRSLFTKK